MTSSAATLELLGDFFPETEPAVSRPLVRELREPEKRAESLHEPPTELNSTTVESTGIKSVAPWLMRGLERLRQFQSLPAKWESSGVAPPNSVAVGLATSVLSKLSEIDAQPNHIDASTGEGVCISFESPGRYADVECFNSGFILGATSRDDEDDSTVWEISQSSIDESLTRILQFVRVPKS